MGREGLRKVLVYSAAPGDSNTRELLPPWPEAAKGGTVTKPTRDRGNCGFPDSLTSV